MLCSLPIASMNYNWLHTVIFNELLASMSAIELGALPTTWPDWIPHEHRPMLQGKTGLRDKVQILRSALAALAPAELGICRSALIAQNNFPGVLQSGQVCAKLEALPMAVRPQIKSLFEYAFGLLTDIETRDLHYDAVYRALHRGVCPFCGLTTLDAPGAPREDLDHYLQISRYPFCGANLRNLSPMCGRCNKSYKKNCDVIWDDTSESPAKASDPYEGPCIEVTLVNSEPFKGEAKDGIVFPNWVVEFVGPADEALTWNRVFKISERYPRDVLNVEFRFWIDSFGRWCAEGLGRIPSAAELVSEIDRYIEITKYEGFSERAFLKVAVFGMFRHCLDQPEVGPQLSIWLSSQVKRFLQLGAEAA